MRSKYVPRLAVLSGIIAVALALRLWGLSRLSMYEDEALTVIVAMKEDLAKVIETVVQANYAPGYFVLLHLWGRVVSWELELLAIPSVVFGVAALLAGLWLGVKTVGWTRASVAILLMAMSPVMIHSSQEIEQFGTIMFLSTMSWCFIWLIQSSSRFDPVPYLGFLLVSTAGLYVHYVALPVIAAQNLYFLVVVRRRIGVWFAVQLVCFFCFCRGLTSSSCRHVP